MTIPGYVVVAILMGIFFCGYGLCSLCNRLERETLNDECNFYREWSRDWEKKYCTLKESVKEYFNDEYNHFEDMLEKQEEIKEQIYGSKVS